MCQNTRRKKKAWIKYKRRWRISAQKENKYTINTQRKKKIIDMTNRTKEKEKNVKKEQKIRDKYGK